MTRAEHLDWSKQRALIYLDPGATPELSESKRCAEAVASMLSDCNKHAELMTHVGLNIGVGLLLLPRPATTEQIRSWIEGFR